MKTRLLMTNLILMLLLGACGNFPDYDDYDDTSCQSGGCQFKRTPAGFPKK